MPFTGRVPEWTKGTDCKSVWRKPVVGSNPTAALFWPPTRRGKSQPRYPGTSGMARDWFGRTGLALDHSANGLADAVSGPQKKT